MAPQCLLIFSITLQMMLVRDEERCPTSQLLFAIVIHANFFQFPKLLN